MYDLIVLGGGSGGLNAALAAAAIGAKVALVEKYKLGGDCTHTACVPSKALLRAAGLAHDARNGVAFGIGDGQVAVNFSAVMERIQAVVAGFAATDSADVLRSKGIDVYFGTPEFEAYDTVTLDRRERLCARKFVIATGSSPVVPPIPGLADVPHHTNATLWGLRDLPRSLLVLGGGPAGVEFAQAFARLGSQVTILNQAGEILPREDAEIAGRLRACLEAEGITIFNGVEVTRFESRNGQVIARFRNQIGDSFEAPRDGLLLTAGRRPNLDGLGLDAVGVRSSPVRGIEVDEYLRTRVRNIYAIGDVIGKPQFTHAAERQAAVVVQNALLGIPKRIAYRALPWTTYSDPEVATVGTLDPSSVPGSRVFRVEYEDLDRARIDGRTAGLAKLLAGRKGEILGVSIVGAEAGAVLAEFVLAMETGRTLGDLLNTVHAYPSYGGLARKLATQFVATRLENRWVRTALRQLYGFQPRG